MVSNQSEIFQVGRTPYDTHFSSMATQQFPSTTLRKEKVRAESFREVGGKKA
jgi:hypothetical protein